MLNASIPTTMGTNSKIQVHDNTKEETWSQLPMLLVWMIMDLLNLADRSRLCFVCQNWKFACQSYPRKPRQQQYCAAPLLIHRHFRTTLCDFINVSTMEKFTLDLPEFRDGTWFYFSRQGWLLLQEHRGHSRFWIVLFNLHTKAKIELPTPEAGANISTQIASFSSFDDGTPRSVVFADCEHRCRILYIANVAEKKWTYHTYQNGSPMKASDSLVVSGHQVYNLDACGNLFIFYMATGEWRELANNTDQLSALCQRIMMESGDGEIVMIDRGRDFKSFSFFKLNDNQTGWEELGDNDAMGRSWFLFGQNNHFAAKEAAGVKKVYRLTMLPEYKMIKTSYNSFVIGFHDLINGVHDIINESMPFQRRYFDEIKWIDLGWVDKLPASCVSYVPSSNQ